MVIDHLLNGLNPKAAPKAYFGRYETLQGLDCIGVFYRDYEFEDGEFCPSGPMRLDRYIAVKTFLKLGMPPGFYRRGFDYALIVNGEAKWLKFAYEGLDGKEHGVFGRDPYPEEWSKKELWLE